MSDEYIIKQLSIFSENKSGKLAAIAKVFNETGVSVQAFNIAEANSFGVVRAIVDKPEIAFDAFAKQNYALKYTDVLAIKMRDVPGGLFEVANLLGELNINIEYAYAFRSGDYGALIIKVADPKEAVELIKKSGLELLPAKEYNY
ncbi:MAG TPA: ACT domain-containing protein [Methanocorpusculum sp.]|nr:ACT domain-containing protein [Methanocorpusculum sp.]